MRFTHSPRLTIKRRPCFKVFASLLGGRPLMIDAVSARRPPKLALECEIERRFRLVSAVAAYLCVTANPSRSCFFDQVQDGILKPVPGAIRSDIDCKDGGQSFEYRPAQVGVASHVPANKPRGITAAAGLQRTQVARFDLGRNPVRR